MTRRPNGVHGEVWLIFNLGNQYGTTVKVARFRGTDFEHTERQPDGVIEVGEQGVSTHFRGGMWYKRWDGKKYYDLEFPEFGSVNGKPYAGSSGMEESCIVGGDYQIPASSDAVRALRAPRVGRVRVQESVFFQADDGRSGRAAILKNALEVWPSMSLRNGERALHDFVVRVDKGDFLFLIAGRGNGEGGLKLMWDPVVTYEGQQRVGKPPSVSPCNWGICRTIAWQ